MAPPAPRAIIATAVTYSKERVLVISHLLKRSSLRGAVNWIRSCQMKPTSPAEKMGSIATEAGCQK